MPKWNFCPGFSSEMHSLGSALIPEKRSAAFSMAGLCGTDLDSAGWVLIINNSALVGGMIIPNVCPRILSPGLELPAVPGG